MNSIEPSGPDGSPTRQSTGQTEPPSVDSPTAEFDCKSSEIHSFATLVPREPSAEQWDALQQRILAEVAIPATTPAPAGPNKQFRRPYLWTTVAALLLVGTLGLFSWITRPVPLEPVAINFESKSVERAPMPRSYDPEPNDSTDPYPLVEAGEFIVVAFEPVPGCGEPIFPPEGCPNCPVVYAAVRP